MPELLFVLIWGPGRPVWFPCQTWRQRTAQIQGHSHTQDLHFAKKRHVSRTVRLVLSRLVTSSPDGAAVAADPCRTCDKCSYCCRYPQTDREEQNSVRGFLMSCLQLSVSRVKLDLTKFYSPTLACLVLGLSVNSQTHMHTQKWPLHIQYHNTVQNSQVIYLFYWKNVWHWKQRLSKGMLLLVEIER